MNSTENNENDGFQLPTIEVVIMSKTINAEVFDVNISSSIDSILPTASFKILDKNGQKFATLKEILLGAHVFFIAYKGQTEIWRSTIFFISRVFNGCEVNSSLLAGAVTVFCEHTLKLYPDCSSHAYKPQKISELIGTITDDMVSTKGNVCKIYKDDANFDKSAEDTNLPRYKCGLSEVEFIEKFLLPKMNMGRKNGFYFLDHKGNFHLKSFENLLKEQPKALISPYEVTLTESELKSINKYASETLNLTKRYSFSKVKMQIGKPDDYFNEFSKGVYIEVPGSTEQGFKVVGFSSTARIKMDTVSKVPLFAESVNHMPVLKSDFFENTFVSEATAIECARQVNLNDLFSIELILNNQIIDDLSVGDTVYFYPKNLKSEDDRIYHWALGKWVVKTMSVLKPQKHISAPLCTMLTLIRPSFPRLNDKSSVDDSFLYGVI